MNKYALYSLLLTAFWGTQAQATQPASLMDVYRLAVSNNADLAAAHATYQASRENTPQARANLLPQIAVGSTHNNSRTRSDKRELSAQTVRRNSYSYQASLSQPLFRLDRWYQFKAAKAGDEQALLELSATEQSLILQSAEAYFAVLRGQDNLAASHAEENAFNQQYRLAYERFNVGLSDQVDVLQAQATYDNAMANRLQAEQLIEDAFQSLVTLTNHQFEMLEGMRHNLPIEPPVPNDVTAWAQRSLTDNLQLRAMDYAVETARQDLLTRKAGYSPTLDAVVQYQKGDNDSLGFANQTNGFNHSRRADQIVTGLQLNIPLYTGGNTSSRIRQGIYQLQTAEHTRENLRRQMVQNARNLHRAVNTNVEQVKARRQSIISSQSALEATQFGYEVGTRTIVDVLDTQRQLYAAVRHYNNARYDYILDLLRLQQVAGSLSPASLLALEEYLYPEYDPKRDFLPPDLAKAAASNMQRRY